MKLETLTSSVFFFGIAILFSCSLSAQENWSDPDTWPNGTLPKANENVEIPKDKTIRLDVSPPELGNMLIEGDLIFQDKDLQLTAKSILVKGTLQIGTEATPFQSDATITLNGPKTDDPLYGGRFLSTIAGGSLQLHGSSAEKLSWGQLEGTVRAGATSIRLDQNATGWAAGDKIVIAPSGYDPFEAEELTITEVNGTDIRFTPALRYDHFGELQTYDGKVLDERAEVGLLTRNITIQGAQDSEEIRFGGHTMILSDSGPIHVEGVEFTRMGQPGQEGRYSFHWHIAGDRKGDYIRNSSIHHALQRGVVLHRTDNVWVENVVAYHIRNHAFIPAEDGNEVNNTFKDNLAMLMLRPEDGFFAFPAEGKETKLSRQGEHRVAGFWSRNPHSNLIGNHSAGSERGVGFFFDGFAKDRIYKEFDVLPRTIVFKDNVAHSCSVPGANNNAVTNVATYGQVGHGHGVFLDGFKNGDLMWRFGDFTAYKNAISGVWSEMLNVTFDNAILADNTSALMSSRSYVQNSLIIGRSENTIGGPNRVLRDGHKRAGYYSIAQGGPKQPKFTNVTFVNINSEIADGDVAAAVVGQSGHYGENYFEGIKLINSQPIYMRTKGINQDRPSGSFLLDRDGSLTGYQKPMIIVHEASSLIHDDAIYHEDWRAYVMDAGEIMQLQFNDIPYSLDISLVGNDGKFISALRSGKTFHFGIRSKSTQTFRGEWAVDKDGQVITAKSVLKRAGDWTIVRYPYPHAAVTVRNADDTEIPAVNSEADLSGQNRTAYYFDKSNATVVVKLVTDNQGDAFARLLAGEGISVGDGTIAAVEFNDIVNVGVTPNPITERSYLEYTLLKEQFIGIQVFDITGRKMKTFEATTQKIGDYQIPLEGEDLQSGVYVVRFQLADQEVAIKVMKQ
ncbi:G8 domain-containing protein [Maribacter sp. 2-571]|uniref:G8 domain-containing protein n=1 Tax=Maribacter sp. 2-571 TaxID=3417569 RepID=UPI003D350FF4